MVLTAFAALFCVFCFLYLVRTDGWVALMQNGQLILFYVALRAAAHQQLVTAHDWALSSGGGEGPARAAAFMASVTVMTEDDLNRYADIVAAVDVPVIVPSQLALTPKDTDMSGG